VGDSQRDDSDAVAALLDAVPGVALILAPDGRVERANTAARHFLARTDVALFGQGSTLGLFPETQRGPVTDVLSQVMSGHIWNGELPVHDRDGYPRRAMLTVGPVRVGDQVRGALLLLDEAMSRGSAQRLATRLTQLARVTNELLLAKDMEAVTGIIIEHLADATGATVASLSLLVEEDTLVLAGLRGGRTGAASRWATYSVHEPTPAGDTIRAGHIQVLTGREEIDRLYPNLERAAEGERSMVCLPLHVGGTCVGVATMSFPGRRTFDNAELEFFGVLADTCAQAIDRIRATAEAADRASKLEFLAEASAELLSSLDYEATLSKVAWLAVPWFADWCAISLEQDGRLRTLAVAHVDPEKLEIAAEFQRRYPTDPDSNTGAYQVLRSGVSELTPEISDEMIKAAVVDREQLEMIRQLNFRSAMVVPLKTKDRVLGVITWVAGEDGRRFGTGDLAFGEDLARRAAVAIDNSQLHSDLREVTVRLQHAVLPGELPRVPGWELTARYAPAGHSEAGGDFYDVVPLDNGGIALFVGDVMGRGLHAAAAMAQIRSAIRAFVAVDPDPRRVMSRLDRFFERFELDQLVTLVYGVTDPVNDELAVVSAGHPAPILLRANGALEQIAPDGGLLLGAGGGDRSVVRTRLGVGDALLAFTDGLVERRGEDIDVGQQRLLDMLPSAGLRTAPSALDDLIEAVRDKTRDDDVAALLVERVPEAPSGR
jgi:GAF domain-containing protein